MIKSFDNIFNGIQSDIDPNTLPDGMGKEGLVWSSGKNIRFIEDYIEKFKGHSSTFGTPSVAPYGLFPVATVTTYYWIYAGLAKVYIYDGSTHTNITRQTASVDVDYTGGAGDKWNGGVISGIPFINNGVDSPQMLTPVSASTKLASLTWASGQTWNSQSKSCKTIRAYKNFMVALDVTESATRYPLRLRWSTNTNGGAPVSWDDTDATESAGFTELNQTNGFLLDCLPLGDTNIIYKEDQTWAMRFVGGNDIFRFDPVFTGDGMLTSGCVQPFFNKHVVLTNGDLILHDGQSIQSIIEKREKNFLFNDIDSTNYKTTFMTPNYHKKEIWICYPSNGSSLPNKALVWNYKDNTFGRRDLPSSPSIAYGVVDPSTDKTWNAQAVVWNTETSKWDEQSYNPSIKRLLIASGTGLYLADDTDQFNGSNMTSFIERTGLDFGSPEVFKYFKTVWPRLTASGPVTVKIGTQPLKGGAISWESGTFDPSTDEKVEFNSSGKFCGIYFGSASNVSWKLHGFDIEYEMGGRY